MIPLQTEVKYEGSSKFLAAWWPLVEGPVDSDRQPKFVVYWVPNTYNKQQKN